MFSCWNSCSVQKLQIWRNGETSSTRHKYLKMRGHGGVCLYAAKLPGSTGEQKLYGVSLSPVCLLGAFQKRGASAMSVQLCSWDYGFQDKCENNPVIHSFKHILILFLSAVLLTKKIGAFQIFKLTSPHMWLNSLLRPSDSFVMVSTD